MVLILEMQLIMDWSKRWSWPMLATTFAAEVRKTARVVVFTPDPVQRGEIRRRLLPKIEPRPLLIEPDQIPLICDTERARAHPARQSSRRSITFANCTNQWRRGSPGFRPPSSLFEPSIITNN